MTSEAYFISYNTKFNQWQIWHSAYPVCKVPQFSGVELYIKEILYKTAVENKANELPRIIAAGLEDKDKLASLELLRREAQLELEKRLV